LFLALEELAPSFEADLGHLYFHPGLSHTKNFNLSRSSQGIQCIFLAFKMKLNIILCKDWQLSCSTTPSQAKNLHIAGSLRKTKMHIISE